jgi:hypothetical protein
MIERRKPSPLKRVVYAGAALGALVLVCLLLLLSFRDPILNRFIKPRITGALADAYPAYAVRIGQMHYSILKDSFAFDSIAVHAVDSTLSGTMGPFSVSAISWMHLLWGGSLTPNDFAKAVVEAHDILVDFPQSQYELRCGLLRVSVPDSAFLCEALMLHPPGDDEQFFAGSTLRRTRFRLAVPNARVLGVAYLEVLQGKNSPPRFALIQDAFLDVLINKDKPSGKETPPPGASGDAFAWMNIDSLSMVNGRLEYGERFAVGAKPALITFEGLQVSAGKIGTTEDSAQTVVVDAQGMFMKTGVMSVRMAIPTGSRASSFQYSGSLGRMHIRALNPFLETAEQIRIVEGVLESATFNISVTSGFASGSVRAVYRDLTLAAINAKTGSENGAADLFASFIANTFKLRGTNMPDKSGAITIGNVKYMRQRNDPFFRFLWFALRSGVGDVVGF